MHIHVDMPPHISYRVEFYRKPNYLCPGGWQKETISLYFLHPQKQMFDFLIPASVFLNKNNNSGYINWHTSVVMYNTLFGCYLYITRTGIGCSDTLSQNLPPEIKSIGGCGLHFRKLSGTN